MNIYEAFKFSILEYPDLWKQYSRLSKKPNPIDLARQSPINMEIDKATGYANSILDDTFAFFVEYIWDMSPEN